MHNYEILKLKPEDYDKCSNIWDMGAKPEMAKHFYDQIVSGNRIIYIYAVDGEYLGEGSLVIERDDPDYSIPEQRIYFSRLIVKKEYRNQGIGTILIDYLCDKAAEMGYSEISVGVDKVNEGAFRLYQRKGFDEIIFDGEDETGSYYKLLKRLDGLEIVYSHELTIEQYNDLRRSVGWNAVEYSLAENGLRNTAYLIVANFESAPIGMARVITDYGYQVLIADVVVHPDFQRKGVGKGMMSCIMKYLDASISPGQWKMINLMAAHGKEPFYSEFGFISRPNDTFGHGMTQTIKKESV